LNNLFKEELDNIQKSIADVSVRRLKIKEKKVFVIFISQITDGKYISDNIIRPLIDFNYKKNHIDNEQISNDLIVSSIIYTDNVKSEKDNKKMIQYILEGNTIIFLEKEKSFLVVNTRKVEKRSIDSPKVESTLKSPRDAFTENLDSNISLIRYRLQNKALKIDYFNVGNRTNTKIAVVYYKDIANKEYVKKIEERIKHIKVDGIFESSYIEKFIYNKRMNLFPQMGICERSDSACANIISGKVCIIVDGSNLALITPKTFIEFFDTGDDHYDSSFISIFLKTIRLIGIFMTLTLSASYVGVVAFHSDMLPAQYILSIASSRIGVPVNAVVEALLMEAIVELLREASIRLPNQIGPAIGIVGTIVIGQAAVFARLVSPLMVIITALSLMASFAVPDYTITNPIRMLKFGMIIITSFLGIFGFVMGITVVVVKLASLENLGIPYTEPLAPFSFKDIKDFLFSNVKMEFKRPQYLNNKDKTKQ